MANIDLSHHLSAEARLRKPTAMKEIWRLASRKPNMVSLANGDPPNTLYPIKKVLFEIASPWGDDPVAAWKTEGSNTATQVISATRDGPSVLPVKKAMQYTNGAGHVETQKAVSELAHAYHHPPNHVITLTLGNGDAVTKCFRLFGNPGDHFLADEFTFSALVQAAIPQGIKWVPVRMDDGGMLPEQLEKIMVNWDATRGPRPHVLYTIPCGQNPTGSTLSVERRRKIYELAQRFDLIIIEDDPYYFLQFPSNSAADTTFTPSFLSMDVDERVVRVDSFSKVIAPGTRLGWITSSAQFHEQLVALTDASSQHPHAFGQMFLSELLGPEGWQLPGFDKWVRGLGMEYKRRCDFFLDLFAKEVATTGLAEAIAPEAGMFVWTRIHISKHPRYRKSIASSEEVKVPRTNCKQLMEELFDTCLDEGLVVMPASIFKVDSDAQYGDPEDNIEDRLNYFRLTYCGTEEIMTTGLSTLGRALKRFFAD
ncbi:L-tyrosine:2-oxoglutarate aminotransferase [Fomitopsis serialis]|uniref:L-tyrosine:2-oxoglutarate aminotransferase n=1 Tax=Fomitopsis serialis TaxID=139415 RepID=UPI0020080B39|nr:L-tyrosine:2-oxoglutarate aminotransferase [Neoantrodia serialis]KAH9923894.1 L-tyrosine:2-oxoglutarate aminotransferase [Neoantrodia serialis]